MEDKILGEGLAFDDVLLVPQKSDVLPSDVDVSTQLTREIRINIPLVSAAMDTVTESALAIALALEGGVGVIHRNNTIQNQVQEVIKVKRAMSGIITEPICLSPEDTVEKARKTMQEFNISGIPVTTGKKLVGIVTSRDLRFQTDGLKKLSEVMVKNLITAPVGTTIEESKKILQEHKIEKLLLVDEDFCLRGLITMKDISKLEKYPNACRDKDGKLRAGAAIGVFDFERADALIKAKCDFLVIDTAHAHTKNVIQTLKELKNKFDIQVIAGNVATEEATDDLIKAGADAVKVGIGPGSICTTRVIAGVGVPQLSAIMVCSKIAKRYNIPVIADGGIRYSGDITKAIAAGADCVMIGALFASATESAGEQVMYKGRAYKLYKGMGSLGALVSGARYRYPHKLSENKFIPEGVEGRVPLRGPLADIVAQLVGGLRTGMGYCGAKNIRELQKKSWFVTVTSAGLRESHPHDVIITKESPNYSFEGVEEYEG